MRYLFGDYILDMQRQELLQAGVPVRLERKVYQLLVYLVQHRDRLVSKDELLTHVWPDVHVDDNTVARYVYLVRRAVGDHRNTQRVIQTRHGQGYRFVAAVLEQTAPAVPVSGAPPAAPRVERKLVTVLCGSLHFTSSLLTDLGSDGLHALHTAVDRLVRQVLQPYAGTLQALTSDRFEVVFGAPVAQEEHAPRALLVALALQQQWPDLAAMAGLPATAQPALSLGVHTGSAVMTQGAGPNRRLTVVGEAPLLAAQLARQAEPGTTLASAATARLAPSVVCLEAIPPVLVVGQSIAVYRVLEARTVSVSPLPHRERLHSRFVGRQAELTTLHTVLERVRQGQGHVVGIQGEPGMGKSRLLYEFRLALAAEPLTYLAGRCESYGTATPYLPLRAVVRQWCGVTDADDAAVCATAVRTQVQRVGLAVASCVPYLLHLLGLADAGEPCPGGSPEVLKARTFTALHQVLLQSSRRQPLVLEVENLHWIDPTSEAYLGALVERLIGVPILLLATYRPGYQPPWLAIASATQMALLPLSPQDSTAIVQEILRCQRRRGSVRAVVARAGGNPFFLEELAQAMAEGEDPAALLTVPQTVETVLAARMDQLPQEAKRLLQTAAVVGMQVPLDLLRPLAALPDEALAESLGHLQRAGLLYETPLGQRLVYTFKHVLTQEVAYQSLLQRTRQQLHAHIAQLLHECTPECADTQPELLAQHYTAAGLGAQAVPYWQRAGQRAAATSAYVEAQSHLATGLKLLATLPESPARARQELMFQMTLAPVLMALKGYTSQEVVQAYTRALALCQDAQDIAQRFVILRGLRRVYAGRAEMQAAQPLGDELLALAQRTQDPDHLVDAHLGVGINAFIVGALDLARTHLQAALERYDAQPYRSRTGLFLDPGVMALATLALVLWLRGYPDQAVQRSQDAVALAHHLGHAYSLDFAQAYATRLAQYRREVQVTRELAEVALAYAQEAGFTGTLAQGRVYHGWALVMSGQEASGLEELLQGISSWYAFGERLNQPYFCTILAEAYKHVGQYEASQRALAEGIAALYNRQHRNHEAELHRLQGELVWLSSGQAAAATVEASFGLALEVARHQQAKSLELRAAMSLSRLWQQQGKGAAARHLLGGVYGWFTEGFETADLQEAQALLATLA